VNDNSAACIHVLIILYLKYKNTIQYKTCSLLLSREYKLVSNEIYFKFIKRVSYVERNGQNGRHQNDIFSIPFCRSTSGRSRSFPLSFRFQKLSKNKDFFLFKFNYNTNKLNKKQDKRTTGTGPECQYQYQYQYQYIYSQSSS
jgi:hypothetical protein